MIFFTVVGMIGLFAIETNASTISWSDAVPVENRAGAMTTPQIAVDKSGNIMAIWGITRATRRRVILNLSIDPAAIAARRLSSLKMGNCKVVR